MIIFFRLTLYIFNHKTDSMEEKNQVKKNPVNIADHLANERTFLSWVRTGIAIMAFGFVLVRFDLFIKQIHLLMQSNSKMMDLPDNKGYSDIFGIALVCLGTILPLLAFFRYRQTAKQIYEKIYNPSLMLSILITFSIIIIGIFLVISLMPD